MKSLFAGYYRPTPEEFDELWKTCIFVLDASVLLDLYRSTAKTRDVALSILVKIKDRIWIPYQAAWEYQENRLGVITKERALYSELRDTFEGLLKSVGQKMHNHAVESAEKIKTELEQSTKKIIEIIDQGANEHPDLMASDHIREKITELFEGKVGKPLNEKQLANVYQEGANRYEAKIPPGYEDVRKGGTRQFGDLVVWIEILEHAKAIKRSVIFITSDTKEDWWWKHGQFTVSPRPELVQEMTEFASVRFYMYNVERFLSEAQRRVDTKVGSNAVKKAAEEFKDIERKKQDTIEVSMDFDKDLALLEKRVLQDPKEVQVNQLRGSFARYMKELDLAKNFISQTGNLSVEQWIQAIETLQGRKVAPNQIAILSDSITRGEIAKLIAPYKNFREATVAVSAFIAVMEKLQAKLPDLYPS